MRTHLITSFFILTFTASLSWADSYLCTTKRIDDKTGEVLSEESKTIEMSGFLDSCQKNFCKRESHISGGNEGDSFSFSLIAHNAKAEVAVMIMSFRLDTKPAFEGSSLAGTDYGSRIYTQVNSGNTTLFIECRYSHL
ncbi:MAG: hypothetical protein AAGB31_12035 [Bdellovibrio sp.]